MLRRAQREIKRITEEARRLAGSAGISEKLPTNNTPAAADAAASCEVAVRDARTVLTYTFNVIHEHLEAFRAIELERGRPEAGAIRLLAALVKLSELLMELEFAERLLDAFAAGTRTPEEVARVWRLVFDRRS